MDVFKEYLAHIDNPQNRTKLEEVLSRILQTFPNLIPQIAWNQPMFTNHGTFIIGFSVAKQHFAVAPEEAAMLHFTDEIKKAGYDYGKKIIRIPWDSTVDFALLDRIIAFNILDKVECSTFWRK